jgi:putative acyl-CoA dehydrogenase
MAAENPAPNTTRATSAWHKAGVTIGMAMTEKQGGTDVRANTTRPIRSGARAGPGL